MYAFLCGEGTKQQIHTIVIYHNIYHQNVWHLASQLSGDAVIVTAPPSPNPSTQAQRQPKWYTLYGLWCPFPETGHHSLVLHKVFVRRYLNKCVSLMQVPHQIKPIFVEHSCSLYTLPSTTHRWNFIEDDYRGRYTRGSVAETQRSYVCCNTSCTDRRREIQIMRSNKKRFTFSNGFGRPAFCVVCVCDPRSQKRHTNYGAVGGRTARLHTYGRVVFTLVSGRTWERTRCSAYMTTTSTS